MSYLGLKDSISWDMLKSLHKKLDMRSVKLDMRTVTQHYFVAVKAKNDG